MPEVDENSIPDPASAPSEGPAEADVSRRRLVVGGLAAAGAFAMTAASFARGSAVFAREPVASAIVSDPTLCVGCLACEVNCSTWHASVGRSAVPRIRVTQTANVVLRKEVAAIVPSRSGFSPSTCRQCPTPWCLPNCPTEALAVDPKTGARVIDEAQCIACGKCEVDCPVEWNGTLARASHPIAAKRVVYDPAKNVYAKCDLCAGRQGGPICVERCPVNLAIRAGSIASNNLCLDIKPSTEEQWKKLV